MHVYVRVGYRHQCLGYAQTHPKLSLSYHWEHDIDRFLLFAAIRKFLHYKTFIGGFLMSGPVNAVRHILRQTIFCSYSPDQERGHTSQ